MASTHAKAVRRASVLQRLSDRLGIQPADLTANAKGDAELALIMTLERVADAVDTQTASVTVAAVEAQLEAETGHEVVQTGDDPPTLVETSKPISKGKGKP